MAADLLEKANRGPFPDTYDTGTADALKGLEQDAMHPFYYGPPVDSNAPLARPEEDSYGNRVDDPLAVTSFYEATLGAGNVFELYRRLRMFTDRLGADEPVQELFVTSEALWNEQDEAFVAALLVLCNVRTEQDCLRNDPRDLEDESGIELYRASGGDETFFLEVSSAVADTGKTVRRIRAIHREGIERALNAFSLTETQHIEELLGRHAATPEEIKAVLDQADRTTTAPGGKASGDTAVELLLYKIRYPEPTPEHPKSWAKKLRQNIGQSVLSLPQQKGKHRRVSSFSKRGNQR